MDNVSRVTRHIATPTERPYNHHRQRKTWPVRKHRCAWVIDDVYIVHRCGHEAGHYPLTHKCGGCEMTWKSTYAGHRKLLDSDALVICESWWESRAEAAPSETPEQPAGESETTEHGT